MSADLLEMPQGRAARETQAPDRRRDDQQWWRTDDVTQESQRPNLSSDFLVVALFCWAGLMLTLAMIYFGADFTPLM